MNVIDLIDSFERFLESIPTPAWTLLGVVVGGLVTLRIETIKSRRRRRAIAQVVFMRLNSLMFDINNLFVGRAHTFQFLLKQSSGDWPHFVYSSLFSHSTLPAYRIARSLSEQLFSQEKDITGVSWIFSKLEVAEATRSLCVASLDNRKRFLIAWYQYCIALSEFAGGCTPYLMTLYDLSGTLFTRVFRFRKRKKIAEGLSKIENAISGSLGTDFYNIFWTKPQRLNRKK